MAVFRRRGRWIAALVLAATAFLIPAGASASPTAIFHDGFETGDLSSWTSSAGLNVQTQQVFAGTYAARSTTSAAWASRTLATTRSQVTLTLDAKLVSRSSAVTLARLGPASGPFVVQLFVNASGKLAYTNNAAGVTRTSAQTFTTGQWHALDMRVTVAGSASTVDVFLDGVAVPELTRTENLGTAPIGRLEIGNRPTGRSFDLVMDEVDATTSASGGSACPSDWSIVGAPGTLRALIGVTAVADDDAWAVGFLDGQQSAPATVHWNGSTWASITPATVGNYRSAFNAVDAASSRDVWAVGYLWADGGESSSKAYRTVIQHWSGSGWSSVTAPNQGLDSNSLVDVDARTSADAWAVGYSMNGDVKRTLAMHWDGAAWQIVPTPSPGATTNALTAVAVVAADDAWAVGYRGSGTGYRPLILHWDGAAWTVQDSSALAHGDETILTGVALSAGGTPWDVGYTDGANGFRSVSGRLASGAWEDVPMDDPGGAMDIAQDVAAAPDGSMWSAGVHEGNQPSSETTLIERRSNGSWTTVVSPNPSATDNALFAITGTPGADRMWAVGRANGDAVILTACPAPAAAASLASTTTAAAAPDPSGVDAAAPLAVALGTAIPVVATDMAAQAGLRFQMRSFPPVVFDYDGDGLLDVFMNHHFDAGSGIYHNRGDGTFQLVQSLPRVDRHGCAAGDVNGDGRPDMYCTTGANYGTDAKSNELWIQTDTGLVDRAVAERVGDPFGRGRWAALLDADHDGNLDLYVGNLRERGDGLPSHNQFWLGTGSSFVPAPGFGLDAELRVGCARTEDFDRDGFIDLLICTNAGPQLQHNDGGAGFSDVTGSIAPNLKGSDGTFADLNGDGRDDLAMVQNGTVQMWLQGVGGSFAKKATVQVPGAQNIAAGDVNADGLPDLYVLRGTTSTAANAPDQMR
jgi:hypothetical protein